MFPLLLLGIFVAKCVFSKLLAPTPPMGFNNWARFQCALNESLFIKTANAMASSGLVTAGYNRINIDDCWPLHDRAANKSLQWDPVKFPNGIPWLAQYVKKLGLQLGIYSDAGNMTCGGYPGSLTYEEIDAKTFQSWGIDYLKMDGCNVPTTNLTLEATYKGIYGHWHEVLSALSTPMIFSESAPAYFAPWQGVTNLSDWYTVMNWVPKYGELARHSDDIQTYDWGGAWASILTNYGNNILFARVQERNRGFYNDPDFLIADHWDLKLDEKKSQFALWCSMSAPLIISADVPALKKEEIEFLSNKDLIAVNQDAWGLQATLVSQDGTWDVLTRSLANGDRLITALNRGATDGNITIASNRLGLPSTCVGPYSNYTAKDLWTGKSKPITVSNGIQATVPSHGTVVYRVTLPANCTGKYVPTGLVFNTKSSNCLTGAHSPSTRPSIGNCTGSDSQVWTFTADDGLLRTIDDKSRCLYAVPGNGTATSGKFVNGTVLINKCDNKSVRSQRWSYDVSGNIKNGVVPGCLTEGNNGTVALSQCMSEGNEQVFEMPSGSVWI
ncbi:hypothetical protein G7Y89_g12121 [Cudoniella acicularis]|uniref:Alpha-galactosidase n=1 Tax=Cudoniella acicularis TaxID=354080 RepID=A0A8H4RBU5_9HELO|nr:hypothetical protein G7Y89_g12121 [Cudoniella acicularis]